MENKYDKNMQKKIEKADHIEAGVRSGALDDEALNAAAGGLQIEFGPDRCHYCRRTGVHLTPRELWSGFVVGICDECRRLHT